MADGDLSVSELREVKFYARGGYISIDCGAILWTAV
jgi:hypothetical protein